MSATHPPLPDETYSCWPEYSEYPDESEPDIDDLQDRLRRYHADESSESNDSSCNSQLVKKVHEVEVKASKGELEPPPVVEDTPDRERKKVAVIEDTPDNLLDSSQMIVEDTPDRDPTFDAGRNICRRRLCFPPDGYATWDDYWYANAETEEPENWHEFKRDNPELFNNADESSP